MTAPTGKTALAPAVQALYDQAVAYRLRSHSPYSNHKVGAALRASDGKIYGGCNIENSSYGGTVCGERTAIWKAASEIGPGFRIEEILVVTDATPPWPPCGLCRQVISEFAPADTPLHAANLQGEIISFRFGDLLPSAFTPGYLAK
jgi:cytidine deaminase